MAGVGWGTKFLLWKHDDPSSVPSIYKNLDMMVHVFVIPVLWRQKQEDPWSLLATQGRQTNEL